MPSPIPEAVATALNQQPQAAPPPTAAVPPPTAGAVPISAMGAPPVAQPAPSSFTLPQGSTVGSLLGDEQLRLLQQILPPDQRESVLGQINAYRAAEGAGYGLNKIQAITHFSNQALDRVDQTVAGVMQGQAQLAVYQGQQQQQMVEGLKQFAVEGFGAYQHSQKFQWNRDFARPAGATAAVIGTAGVLGLAGWGIYAALQ